MESLSRQKFVSLSKGIKFGSWRVRAKACHVSGKAENQRIVCSVATFEIFENQLVESLPRPKCSSHTKKYQYRISSFAAYPIIQPVTERPSYITQQNRKRLNHLIKKEILEGKVNGRKGRGRPSRHLEIDVEAWKKMGLSTCTRALENRDFRRVVT